MVGFLKKQEKKPYTYSSLQIKKSPKNYKRLVIFIFLLALTLFSLYVNKYQKLVSEGSYLADEHCIKVNPLIIDRKNKYLDQYNLMLASASAQEVQDAVDKYFKVNQVYLDEEKVWLAKQRKYINSKSFNLLMPSYIKEAANYQYAMYEADYNASLYLFLGFKEEDKNKQLELTNKVVEETAKSKDAGDKYNGVWNREKGRSDWIYRFVKVPLSKCPAENYNIPDIPNPFLPPVFSRSPLS